MHKCGRLSRARPESYAHTCGQLGGNAISVIFGLQGLSDRRVLDKGKGKWHCHQERENDHRRDASEDGAEVGAMVNRKYNSHVQVRSILFWLQHGVCLETRGQGARMSHWRRARVDHGY